MPIIGPTIQMVNISKMATVTAVFHSSPACSNRRSCHAIPPARPLSVTDSFPPWISNAG